MGCCLEGPDGWKPPNAKVIPPLGRNGLGSGHEPNHSSNTRPALNRPCSLLKTVSVHHNCERGSALNTLTLCPQQTVAPPAPSTEQRRCSEHVFLEAVVRNRKVNAHDGTQPSLQVLLAKHFASAPSAYETGKPANPNLPTWVRDLLQVAPAQPQLFCDHSISMQGFGGCITPIIMLDFELVREEMPFAQR